MKKWTEGELFDLKHGSGPSGYLTRVELAASHIQDLQDAVEILRAGLIGIDDVLEIIDDVFWPSDDVETDLVFTAGDWPCEGDNW